MHRILLIIAACALCLAVMADTPPEPVATEPAPQPDTVQDAPAAVPPDLRSLLAGATEDQRVRMFRFIRNRYPTLTVDLIVLLQTRNPGIFVTIDRELQSLITANYPGMSGTVQRTLQEAINERYPQVRNEIAELIQRDYPDLLRELRQGGTGDPASQTARLIRERHRALLDDVLCLLREQHPTLLQEVQREILVKHPELMVEVALLIVERYPELSEEITRVLADQYPELIPGILGILTQAPAEEAPPPEEVAPAEE